MCMVELLVGCHQQQFGLAQTCQVSLRAGRNEMIHADDQASMLQWGSLRDWLMLAIWLWITRMVM